MDEIYYKNVDIYDLPSILENGLLSMDESGNNNWQDNNRADNRTDVVYLFRPVNEGTLLEIPSFPEYGAALVECTADAEPSKMSLQDCHFGKYREYIAKRIAPENILRVFIPKLFEKNIDITSDKICLCRMKASVYGKDGLVEASADTVKLFAETAPVRWTQIDGYFRGIYNDGSGVFDLYNVRYQIPE